MAEQRDRRELADLTRRVRSIERGGDLGRVEPRPLATGWGLDRALGGGLARGAVHEWLGLDDAAGAERMRGGLAAWTPPLFLLVELCRRALEEHTAGGREGWVVWIGSRVWPYPRVLASGGIVRSVGEVEALVSADDGLPAHEGLRTELRLERADAEGDRTLLERSLFVDPVDLSARVWAADGALRCPSVAAVVIEGKGLRVPAGRRLQLAAESSGGLAFVARAADEVREVSAAATRWRVRRQSPDDDAQPRWELELLKARAGLIGSERSIASSRSTGPDRSNAPIGFGGSAGAGDAALTDRVV